MYLLQSAPGGGGFQFIFLGLMIVVFWLFFFRPQAKKAKQQKTFIDNLQKDNKVITISGIHVKIKEINKDITMKL
jgi:preprotein translocase subunit YajC